MQNETEDCFLKSVKKVFVNLCGRIGTYMNIKICVRLIFKGCSLGIGIGIGRGTGKGEWLVEEDQEEDAGVVRGS